MAKTKANLDRDRLGVMLAFVLEDVAADLSRRLETLVLARRGRSTGTETLTDLDSFILLRLKDELFKAVRTTLLRSRLRNKKVCLQRAVLSYLLAIPAVPAAYRPKWFAQGGKDG